MQPLMPTRGVTSSTGQTYKIADFHRLLFSLIWNLEKRFWHIFSITLFAENNVSVLLRLV